MVNYKSKFGHDIYSDKYGFKWLGIGVFIILSVASIVYTHDFVKKFKVREQKQIELFARALEFIINENQNSNLYLIAEKILFQNNSIPTILVNQFDSITSYRNIDLGDYSDVEIQNILKDELEEMKDIYPPILVEFRDKKTNKIYDIQYIYYKNSLLLEELIYYPYLQIFVIIAFATLAYLTFSYLKTAEQNQVWVGLAKETAHQLGTPISSLWAWLENLKEDEKFKNSVFVDSLEKDITKLQVVTERFSNIGSEPSLSAEQMDPLIKRLIEYLRFRLPKKINFNVESIPQDVSAYINPPLFEWVIENLVKNAVDSMGGFGDINISIIKTNEGKIFVDIKDTGKGIHYSKIKNVFKPGYTTKTRGWGLGLTLAKRIIENYHSGKIFVKESREGVGTTFRITLRCAR